MWKKTLNRREAEVYRKMVSSPERKEPGVVGSDVAGASGVATAGVALARKTMAPGVLASGVGVRSTPTKPRPRGS